MLSDQSEQQATDELPISKMGSRSLLGRRECATSQSEWQLHGF